MPPLSRSAEEIASVIKQEIEQYRAELDVSDTGKVLEVGDGIARIYGLHNAMAGEILDFGSDIYGQVFNLEEDSIGAVILGDCRKIREGADVRSTGRLLDVPVGEGVLGRVIDPLGLPLDGKGPVKSQERRPVEMIAPGIAKRQPVNEPLQTGIKAIDSMIPIGRGQRELIIGDRKTGKTQIALDTIINQRGTGVICIYVAIGQKASTVASVVDALREHGAMDYTVVVHAAASDPAPLQYIAPYSGCAIGEHFMYGEGRHVLCVYDDLTKQAAAYRELSLLLRRPPGREAYPGDVFYLHSRLLERAVKMAERHIIVRKGSDPRTTEGVDGKVYAIYREPAEKALAERPDAAELEVIQRYDSGGSLTALPIIETQEGEVSAYIPTNVISITDGQIYLLPDLFNAGIRPAVDVGISVSRVGGAAQVKGVKRFAGSLRLDLAAFRELEAFAQLGTELDAASERQLARGYRMVELLKQGIYKPLHVVDQIIVIFAGSQGFMDQTPPQHVPEFGDKLITHFREQEHELWEAIDQAKDLDEATEKILREKLRSFAGDFNRRFQES